MANPKLNSGVSLPVISNVNALQQYMATWRANLSAVLKRPSSPPPPQSFQVKNARGGVELSWRPGALTQNSTKSPGGFAGPDGYEILKSVSGNFIDDLTIIPVRDPNASSYFDSLGCTVGSCSYRIRATAGTSASPYSVHGVESGIVNHTSIDCNDTTTTPVTKTDNFTTDIVRATARFGRYGASLK